MEMEEDDKPFECPVCKMRFVNEDRLSVHKERHKFALSLNTSTPKLTEISDQTPTPTRFIRNCEDVGLFSDLVNPFEEHFRRASQSGSSALINCNPSQPSESLNTPYIPIATSDILTSKLILENKSIIKKQVVSPDVDSETNPFPVDESETEKPEIPTVLLKTPKLTLPLPISTTTSVIATCTSPRILSVSSPNPSQATVITSVGLSSTRHKLSGVPTAVVVKPRPPTTTTITGTILKKVVKNPVITPTTTNVTLSSEPAMTNSASQGLVLQLILKLPDGQSMPFNIPAVPANSTGVPQNIVAVAAPSAAITTAQISTPKMKLKDTLEQQIMLKTNAAPIQAAPNQIIGNSTVRLSSIPANVGINIPPVISTVNSVANQNNVAAVVPTVRMSNSNMVVSNNHGKRKRSDDEDPDVKRRKFLERNRAAATRCRRKRKEKFDQLEMKAQELTKTKEQLEGMVSVLRKEVAQLKSMLLAHKDCPITQQQKAEGQPSAFDLCNMAINIQSLCSTSSNPTFQTISGLTSNDSGGIEVLTFIGKTEDDISQTSESSMMEPAISIDTSNDSSAFQEHLE